MFSACSLSLKFQVKPVGVVAEPSVSMARHDKDGILDLGPICFSTVSLVLTLRASQWSADL